MSQLSNDTTDTDTSISSSDDDLSILVNMLSSPPMETVREVAVPFKNREFKLPSNWSPPGPSPLEAFISMNQLGLGNLPRSKPKTKNMTIEELQGLITLKKNPDIVIKGADKGSAVVIMDRKDYISEGLKQLSDNKFYTEKDTDLTPSFKVEIGMLLRTKKPLAPMVGMFSSFKVSFK